MIIQKLSRYKNENSKVIYNIEAKSNIEKLILTKNAAGNATNFRFNLNITFILTDNGNVKEFVFSEKFDMKKGNNILRMKNMKILLRMT